MARRRDKRAVAAAKVEDYEGDDEDRESSPAVIKKNVRAGPKSRKPRDESPPASRSPTPETHEDSVKDEVIESEREESPVSVKASQSKKKKKAGPKSKTVQDESPSVTDENVDTIEAENGKSIESETEQPEEPPQPSSQAKRKSGPKSKKVGDISENVTDESKEENGTEIKDEPDEHEVEQIVGMEVNYRWKCPVKFRVRWVGFGEKDDTWEQVENLNCTNFVDDFLQISARKSEYDKAMERAAKNNMANTMTVELRRKTASSKVDYCEDESDEECQSFVTRTRTRLSRPPQLFDPSSAAPQLLHSRKKEVSRAMAQAEQAGREYEVDAVVGCRGQGIESEYKVSWKGLDNSHNSWLPKANLTCSKLIADYHKALPKAKPSTNKSKGKGKKGKATPSIKQEESEDEQGGKTDVENDEQYEVAAIVDSREQNGKVSYKVRWKGFSSKHDSWLPKEEMNCPGIVNKFEEALDKLNKKEDWVVHGVKGKRGRGDKIEYLVHWQGFEDKFDTWEPAGNLEGCQDKLDEYAAKEKRKRKSTAGDDDSASDVDNEAKATPTRKKSRPSSGGARERRSSVAVKYEEQSDQSE